MSLAVIRIRAVTFETFVGKDGPDIKIEAYDFRQVIPRTTAGAVQAGHPEENDTCHQGQYGTCSKNCVLFG
jgi:hypothetical protein